jgi:aryl-alcohol dehydrogenase-like predicted oxidoreductase
MRYNPLGRSGLYVSELCLGTMTFGGGDGMWQVVGKVQQEEADAILKRALDAGINFLDTANIYSEGASETILGQGLKNLGIARDQVVVATKVLGRMSPGPNGAGASRGHIMAQVEQSLKRLQTDFIDLYQLHGIDPLTPMEEMVEALDNLVRRGLVRYVGVSNWAAWQVAKAVGIAEARRLTRPVSLQAYYTIAGRDLEREIVPMLQSEGVGLMVWSPLAGGLLSGKYRRGQQAPDGSRHLTDWNEPPVRDEEQTYDVIEAAVEIGEAHGVSAAQVALAWLLGRPGVTSLVIGARTEEQLADNLAAADLELSAEERARLDELSAPPLIYPHWHQAKTAADRLGPADRAWLAPYLDD